MKLWDWVLWNQRLKKKTIIKKKLYLLCVYINDWYYQINTWKQWHRSNNRWCYHIIAKWKACKEQLGHKNIPAITNKYDKTYKKHRYEVVDETIKQPNRRFLRIGLGLKIKMNCRTDESCSLKKIWGLTYIIWLILKNKQY